MRVFSHRLRERVSESTVRSIRDAYRQELRKRSREDDEEEMSALPTKKRGKHVMLGEDLNKKVQMYIKKTRESGGAVSVRSIVAEARGIVLKLDHSLLAELGGPVTLNRHWARSLLRRMKFVQRKATTAKSKYTVENFAEIKKAFLQDVVSVVTMEEVPPELILNWDQTGIKLVPCSSWTMEKKRNQKSRVVGC